jgi:hypothetical protein
MLNVFGETSFFDLHMSNSSTMSWVSSKLTRDLHIFSNTLPALLNTRVFLCLHVTLAFGRLRYPEEFLHFSREDRLEFKQARYAIADTLTSAAAVVGPAQTLHIISSPLREFSKFVVSGTPDWSMTPGLDWRALEAALYAIRSISKESPPPGDEYLISLLLSLADLPNHPQLLYTATLTASAYSEWYVRQLSISPILFYIVALWSMLCSDLFKYHNPFKTGYLLVISTTKSHHYYFTGS